MGCLDVSEFLCPDEISEVAQDKNIEAVTGEVLRKKLLKRQGKKSPNTHRGTLQLANRLKGS